MVEEPIVTIAKFVFAHRAELAKVLLKEEGIECFLADETQAAYSNGVLFPVRLQVLESDREAAREILDRTNLYPMDGAVPAFPDGIVIAAFITGHGFGHAVRMATVLREIQRTVPGTFVYIYTTAPEKLFAETLPGPYHIDSAIFDTGAVEKNVLFTDAKAGIPSIAIANFTWDRIYRDYPNSDKLVKKIRDYYAQTTLALEVPLGHELDAFPEKVQVPIIARKAMAPRDEVRRELGIGADKIMVAVVLRGDELQGNTIPSADPRLLYVTYADLHGDQIMNLDESWQGRFPDVIGASDAVLSKPGYGIVGECIANRVPLLHLPREGFAETPYLLDAMDRWMAHQAITLQDVSDALIEPMIVNLLQQKFDWPDVSVNGAEVAADKILELATKYIRA